MSSSEILECVILDEALKKHYPQGVLHLVRGKALDMEQRGLVAIAISDRSTSTVNVSTKQTNEIINNHDYLSRDRFAPRARRLARIAYIQDNSKLGGAEISNIRVTQVGQECGFDIVGITPAHRYMNIIEECDAAIINNFFEFPTDSLRMILRTLIERGIPYAKYDHDYRELRRTTLAQAIFRHASMAVFISPRHAKRMHEHLRSARLHEISTILPLAINPDIYKDMHEDRKAGSVLIPTWRKGKEAMMKYISENPKNDYTIIGQCDQHFPNISIRHIPACPYQDMPVLYNKFESVLHMPDDEWAGERIYFEATLCGCKFIGNERVGHLSWASKSVDELRDAPYKFWGEVEKRCLQ
jgi:hypothetical protein